MAAVLRYDGGPESSTGADGRFGTQGFYISKEGGSGTRRGRTRRQHTVKKKYSIGGAPTSHGSSVTITYCVCFYASLPRQQHRPSPSVAHRPCCWTFYGAAILVLYNVQVCVDKFNISLSSLFKYDIPYRSCILFLRESLNSHISTKNIVDGVCRYQPQHTKFAPRISQESSTREQAMASRRQDAGARHHCGTLRPRRRQLCQRRYTTTQFLLNIFSRTNCSLQSTEKSQVKALTRTATHGLETFTR